MGNTAKKIKVGVLRGMNINFLGSIQPVQLGTAIDIFPKLEPLHTTVKAAIEPELMSRCVSAENFRYTV